MCEKYSYRITWSDEEQSYIGLCAEFPSLSWIAETQEKAFRGIRKLTQEIVVDMKENGEEIPVPISIRNFSGKFMVRITPELHRTLILRATEEHVSLNRYISAKLAETKQCAYKCVLNTCTKSELEYVGLITILDVQWFRQADNNWPHR